MEYLIINKQYAVKQKTVIFLCFMVKDNMPVHLAKNDPRPTTNSLGNVINSFSIGKVSCFIEKKVLKKVPREMFFVFGGGEKNTKNEENR